MNRLRVGFAVSGLASLMLISRAALADGLPPNLERAAAALGAATGKEQVQWNISQARTADVTCDGKPDIVMFGVGHRSVWMGMVPGGAGKPLAIRFPYPAESQDGFSDRPKRIGFYPFNCVTDAAGRLAGCRQFRGCMAFDLDDGETDPFNFYWDDRHKRLDWWRN
jgi:hypothetical protein